MMMVVVVMIKFASMLYGSEFTAFEHCSQIFCEATERDVCPLECGWDDVMQVCGAISVLRRVWQRLNGVIGGRVHTVSRWLHFSCEQLIIELCYTFIGDCQAVWQAEECFTILLKSSRQIPTVFFKK
jgi:hypothetical protein